MNYFKSTFLILISTLFFLSCSNQDNIEIVEMDMAADFTKAGAMLNPLGDSGVSGNVYFTQTEAGVLVEAEVTGLTNPRHGFHIHQYGDCSASDGTSAGGHLSPDNDEHGSPSDDQKHLGDLGNLEKSATSDTARYNFTFPEMNLSDISGRGVIVHAEADDLVSQPTGDAGARLACGVIGVMQN